MQIAANYIRLREEIPPHVTTIVAVKARSVEEVIEVIDAGATDMGENYVQEASRCRIGCRESTSGQVAYDRPSADEQDQQSDRRF